MGTPSPRHLWFMQLVEADNVGSSYDPLPHCSGGFGKEPFWVQNLGYIVCKPLF